MDEHDQLVDLAREVPVPSGGTLVESAVIGVGPNAGPPYIGYAHHRYDPSANGTRLASLVRAALEDRGWTMGPVETYVERAGGEGGAFVPVASALGKKDGYAVEVRAGRYAGGACCYVTDDASVGILLAVRVRAI